MPKPEKVQNQPGITTTHWFWASMEGLAPKAKVPAPTVVSDSAEVIARDLLTKHPEMNAATFLNSLAASGIKLVKEADNSGSNVAALRAKESRAHTFVCPMVESTAAERGMVNDKFKVILLREGLGNFGDAFFYTRQALESGIRVFEGKKIYANHPRKSDEEDLPERDVRDVVGYYSGLAVEEGPDGQALLTGVAHMMQEKSYEWARALMREAVEYSKKYPDQDFVGLSINANGESTEMNLDVFMRENPGLPESCVRKLKEAAALGVEVVRVATNFTEAVSCDLVTEAGAGGKVIAMLEGERKMAPKAKKNREAEGGAGHDDAAQDKELISAMLKKHLGGDQHDEATHEAAMEAYQAAKESGMESEAALETVGHSMKMSHILKAKREAAGEKSGDECKDGSKEAVESKEAAEKEASEKKEAVKESKAGNGGKSKDKDMETKEELMTLRGEVAALRESAAKSEAKEKVEELCRESGMTNKATKVFREGVKDAKTVAEVERSWAIFKKGYESHGEADGSEFVESAEKGGKSAKSGEADFSDCVAD